MELKHEVCLLLYGLEAIFWNFKNSANIDNQSASFVIQVPGIYCFGWLGNRGCCWWRFSSATFNRQFSVLMFLSAIIAYNIVDGVNELVVVNDTVLLWSCGISCKWLFHFFFLSRFKLYTVDNAFIVAVVVHVNRSEKQKHKK